MSEPLIRRRTLPGSLRYLAQRLAAPLTEVAQHSDGCEQRHAERGAA